MEISAPIGCRPASGRGGVAPTVPVDSVGANCVVRVSFTGLDNMFHIPYEHYALDDYRAI